MKLVGERRALAAIIFAFYFLMYFLAVVQGMVPPEFNKAFSAIAGVYGLAFFSLVAGYFWARWYAVGVGLYGIITAAVGIWQIGTEPVLVFVGGTHLAATLMLWGEAMSKPYDGQTAWREKLHMDENAVQRLGRSVIRAGVSLPFVLLYALAPKPEAMLGLLALVLTGVGLAALVRFKTWGVLALGAAGSILVMHTGASVVSHGMTTALIAPSLAGVLLISASIRWVPAMARYVTSR